MPKKKVKSNSSLGKTLINNAFKIGKSKMFWSSITDPRIPPNVETIFQTEL